jgi:hypothetical protein
MLFSFVDWCVRKHREKKIALIKSRVEPLMTMTRQMQAAGVDTSTPIKRIKREDRPLISRQYSDIALQDGCHVLPNGELVKHILLHGLIGKIETYLPDIATALRQRGHDEDATLVDSVIAKLEGWCKITAAPVISNGAKPVLTPATCCKATPVACSSPSSSSQPDEFENYRNCVQSTGRPSDFSFAEPETFGDKLSQAIDKACTVDDSWESKISQKSIARKVLQCHELKVGSTAVHDVDLASIAYYIPRRGAVPMQSLGQELVCCPTFEIACYPKVTEHMTDELRDKTIDAANKEETSNLLNLLRYAALGRPEQTFKTSTINWEIFKKAFAAIAQHDLVVTHIVINPVNLLDIRDGIGIENFDESGWREMNGFGLWGHVHTADVIGNSRMNTDEIFFVASSAAGHLDIKQPLTYLPVSANGTVVYEEIGMSITKDYAIAKIEIVPESNEFSVTTDGDGNFIRVNEAEPQDTSKQ